MSIELHNNHNVDVPWPAVINQLENTLSFGIRITMTHLTDDIHGEESIYKKNLRKKGVSSLYEQSEVVCQFFLHKCQS